MAAHSSVLAWRIPWTEEPGSLQSMGSHRLEHNWSDLARTQHKCILECIFQINLVYGIQTDCTFFFSPVLWFVSIRLCILYLKWYFKTLMIAFFESFSREVQKFLRNTLFFFFFSKTGILPVIANIEKCKIYDICLWRMDNLQANFCLWKDYYI